MSRPADITVSFFCCGKFYELVVVRLAPRALPMTVRREVSPGGPLLDRKDTSPGYQPRICIDIVLAREG